LKYLHLKYLHHLEKRLKADGLLKQRCHKHFTIRLAKLGGTETDPTDFPQNPKSQIQNGITNRGASSARLVRRARQQLPF
jgi:hypothetical protein